MLTVKVSNPGTKGRTVTLKVTGAGARALGLYLVGRINREAWITAIVTALGFTIAPQIEGMPGPIIVNLNNDTTNDGFTALVFVN